jgi:aspartate ammonia-lyase
VQAQPITYGHYLAAYGQALARDGERVRQTWGRLNKSPLGSAALGSRLGGGHARSHRGGQGNLDAEFVNLQRR